MLVTTLLLIALATSMLFAWLYRSERDHVRKVSEERSAATLKIMKAFEAQMMDLTKKLQGNADVIEGNAERIRQDRDRLLAIGQRYQDREEQLLLQVAALKAELQEKHVDPA